MTSLRRGDVARLVALAVIWSASFVFIRVIAAPLGPVWTATLRMLVAGVALVAYFMATGYAPGLRRHWRACLVVGGLNCALPFLLYAWAALTLPASYLVILNAATPSFAAMASALWLGERFGGAKLAGLAAGAAGVALVSRAGPLDPTPAVAAAIVASLAGAACYALSAVWLKRRGGGLDPKAVAGGSLLAAGIAMLPIAAASPAPGPVTPAVAANLLALALVCTAIAYLLYFRLIGDIGPTRTMTVTFLMPAFGLVWSMLFLDETVTAPMLAGTALVVAGTVSVLKPARPTCPAPPVRS
ncbi:putative amino-acid metabolite efflux pump [Burkholderiales bacterium]|nr:putative amino-acid metabolite efflux pump [Burkholderiales bacterium]